MARPESKTRLLIHPFSNRRAFAEMQQLMDPSRNMSRYRNLVNGEEVQPPIIPFYPVVKKDLTFIHLANDTNVDGLVNFEKLRYFDQNLSRSKNCPTSVKYQILFFQKLKQ